MYLLTLVEWNQPPMWTSFSASAQPAAQVQLQDVHLKLQKATRKVKLSYTKDIHNYRITEYSELEGTHEDHRVQFLRE